MPVSRYFELGYSLAALALALVILYFFLVAAVLRLLEPQSVLVTRYDPPSASPGVAAWLLERGDLSRAVAGAIASMAAKGYVKIEQSGDLYSITQMGPDVSLDLQPEEDALARTLFKGYDCFDFDEPTPQLRDALSAFHTALEDTRFFSKRIVLSVPAWCLSVAGIGLALIHGNFLAHAHSSRLDGRLLGVVVLCLGCFVVAIRTLPQTLQKIASRLPGSTAPKRPWSDADSTTFTLFVAGIGGIGILALFSAPAAAIFVAAFVAVNAIFYHAVQGPTAAGRKALKEIVEYKKFFAEVESDPISRTHSSEAVPAQLAAKHAYAIAFHLDLGWGEQFVAAVASLVEQSEVLGRLVRQPET